MNKKFKRKLSVIMLALLVGTSSLAYFTDKVSGGFEATAAGLCIDVEASGDIKNMVPGEERPIDLKVTNLGSVDIDTRVTFEVNIEEVLIEPSMARASADYLFAIKSNDEAIAELNMWSVSEKTEGRSIKSSEVGPVSIFDNLTLEINEAVGNIFLDKDFTVKAIVEAKQSHKDAPWEKISTVTYTLDSYHKVELVDESISCRAKEQDILLDIEIEPYSGPKPEESEYVEVEIILYNDEDSYVVVYEVDHPLNKDSSNDNLSFRLNLSEQARKNGVEISAYGEVIVEAREATKDYYQDYKKEEWLPTKDLTKGYNKIKVVLEERKPIVN